MVTGTAGTAKTILASYFAAGGCERKERTLYLSFEESPEQLVRNMQSVGIDLNPYIKSKLLVIHSSRPSLSGLEMHLLVLHRLIEQHQPQTIVVDPISSLVSVGSFGEVRDMLIRLIDLLKTKGINAYFTSLTHAGALASDSTIDAVSSLADNWINVTNETDNRNHVRSLRIVKARGMGHETTPQHFTISRQGIKLYSGEEGITSRKNK